MNCEQYQEHISQFIDGELPPAAETGLFIHLGACEQCRTFLKNALSLRQTLVHTRPITVPASLDQRILAQNSLATKRLINQNYFWRITKSQIFFPCYRIGNYFFCTDRCTIFFILAYIVSTAANHRLSYSSSGSGSKRLCHCCITTNERNQIMKNHAYLFFSLIILTGFSISLFAQTNNIHSPETEIAFDKRPEVIKRVEPIYPASMLEGGWEAVVYVKAFIDLDGNVKEAKSEKIQIKSIRTDKEDAYPQEQSTDRKAFEESALSAVYQWKFTPARMQEKPVAVWVTIPFRFKLNSDKKGTSAENSNKAVMEKRIESIKTVIENILKGKEIETAKKYIDINASLIYNTKMVNLYSVLNGEYKDVRLTEGKETQCVNFNVNITDGGNSALIVWTSELPKGKNKRIHSIVISKGASDEWKITHWHVSF